MLLCDYYSIQLKKPIRYEKRGYSDVRSKSYVSQIKIYSTEQQQCHITPILRSLHCLKITERIECKLLSLTYKVLSTTQNLHNLITVQPPRTTRSSSSVTLARPSTSSSLRITNRSFQCASPRLWNQLPASLRQPCTKLNHALISPILHHPVL